MCGTMKRTKLSQKEMHEQREASMKEEKMEICEKDVTNKSKGKRSKENKGGREGDRIEKKEKIP